MKFVLCLAVASIALVVVSSESCMDVGDCQHTQCDSETKLGCSHRECTCLETAGSQCGAQTTCSARADCSSCSCRQGRNHHCYDGHCTCGFGGFGK